MSFMERQTKRAAEKKKQNGRVTRSTYFQVETDVSLTEVARTENRSVANMIEILVREALTARGELK